MEGNQRLCIGCMSIIDREEKCPLCGYHQNAPNPDGALAVGETLQNRYKIGRLLWRNSIICAYIAWDIPKGRRVYIEEFMPVQLAQRKEGQRALWVEGGDMARFKTMISDLADCWKRLARMDNRCLPTILDIFSEGDTLYRVEVFIPAVRLEAYLHAKGAFSWQQAKALLMPLFSLVSNLHNKGLVHGGISPQTIMVGAKGQVWLTGFSLPELRTDGSGIAPELFEGYSAPEQYSKTLFQGEWTDIYSLGAVLYRVLTQQNPPSALQRQQKSLSIQPISAQIPQVPKYVSVAVAQAMELSKKNRFQSVNAFTAALLEETSSNTAVFQPEPSMQRPTPKVPLATRMDGRNVLGLALAASMILNLIMAAAMISYFIQLPSHETPLVQEEDRPLMRHDLTGMLLSSAQSRQAAYGIFVEVVEERYSETVPANIIIGQTVEPGQRLPDDKTVGLIVSKGSAYVEVPYLIGSSELYARRVLSDLGLPFEVVYSQEPDVEGADGTIISMDRGMGDRISKEYFDTEKVTITIKRMPGTEE